MTTGIRDGLAARPQALAAPGDGRAMRTVRSVAWLMLAEVVSLAVSSRLHLSGIVTGRSAPFDGTRAGIAEAIIAIVLTGGPP